MMLSASLCFVVLSALVLLASSSATVWPQPQQFSAGTGVVTLDASSFSFSCSSSSDVLSKAFSRYQNLVFWNGKHAAASGQNVLNTLQVEPGNVDAALQFDQMDESYSISIDSTGATAVLSSKTVWGALRGLETFSQLVEFNFTSGAYFITQTPVQITDSPRFKWRGLLVDTSRHYYPTNYLLHILDVMSYSKYNVLHWHAVDAQSFPMQYSAYPNLSGDGAYAPAAIYSKDDRAAVIDYAHDLGIRVVLELDTPGHAYAWGLGYPELTANCPSYAANINNIPLNPTLNNTYTVLDALLEETFSQFTDDYFHTGGDEVVFGCWSQDAQIAQWMQQEGITTVQLYQYFELKMGQLVTDRQHKVINWEEVVDNNLQGLGFDRVIQVWKDRLTLERVLQLGYYGLLSAGWYLDKQNPSAATHYEWEDTWMDFYLNEPFQNLSLTDEQKARMFGGEAAMWSEQVDQNNFDSRVWPRACATAERLWSNENVNDVTSAKPRLNEQSCRLQRRGVQCGPIMPGYCAMPSGCAHL